MPAEKGLARLQGVNCTVPALWKAFPVDLLQDSHHFPFACGVPLQVRSAGLVRASPAFVCASCSAKSTCVLNVSEDVAASLLWCRNGHSSGRERRW